jgi:hypothetical protein
MTAPENYSLTEQVALSKSSLLLKDAKVKYANITTIFNSN